MQAITADCEDRAIKLLSPYRPDLIVVDADLPRMREGTLIRDIRSQPAGLDVPVIAIGTPHRSEKRLSLLRLGADEILPKPVDQKELLFHARALLHRRAGGFITHKQDRELWALTESAAQFKVPKGPFVLISEDRELADRLSRVLKARVDLQSDPTAKPVKAAMLIDPNTQSLKHRLPALIADPETSDTPKILLVSRLDPEALQDFNHGLDAIAPVAACDDELRHRIFAALNRKQEAVRKNDHYRNGWIAALTDPLTGLPNRRHALAHLGTLLSKATVPFAMAIGDLDHFKSVNDDHGHAVGDEILCHIAEVLCDAMDPSGFVGRLGGEEFLLLWPSQSEKDAASLASKLCALVRHSPLRDISATISLGLTLVTSDDIKRQPEELLARADRALYRSKHTGRDCATLADPVA